MSTLGGDLVVGLLQRLDLGVDGDLALEGLAGEVLVAGLEGELGLVVPVGGLGHGVGELLGGHLLGAHGLAKCLGGLVDVLLDLDDELLDHLLGILGLVDHVVDVGLEDVGDA